MSFHFLRKKKAFIEYTQEFERLAMQSEHEAQTQAAASSLRPLTPPSLTEPAKRSQEARSNSPQNPIVPQHSIEDDNKVAECEECEDSEQDVEFDSESQEAKCTRV